MARTLIFGDAHEASKTMYEALKQRALTEGVDRIVFLGDIDGIQNYKDFREVFQDTKIECIIGNHEQALIRYNDKLDDEVKIGPKNRERQPDLTDEQETIEYMKNLERTKVEDGILYTHAFPKGKILSGTTGDAQPNNDQRTLERDLWHSGFNTHDVIRDENGYVQKVKPSKHIDSDGNECYFNKENLEENINRFDPQVVSWNLDHAEKQGADIIVKAHEHTGKVTKRLKERNGDSRYGIRDGKRINIRDQNENGTRDIDTNTEQAIVQVGQFQSGHYAIIEEQENKQYKVEFKNINS